MATLEPTNKLAPITPAIDNIVTWRDFSPAPKSCDCDSCPIIYPLEVCHTGERPDVPRGARVLLLFCRSRLHSLTNVLRFRMCSVLCLFLYACFASLKQSAMILSPCSICASSMVSGTRMRSTL